MIKISRHRVSEKIALHAIVAFMRWNEVPNNKSARKIIGTFPYSTVVTKVAKEYYTVRRATKADFAKKDK